jgi:spore coat polysaccharide biosynthesis protein SpsF
MIRVFIQARMSSKRFPGKVVAPFRGRPIIACVVSRVAAAIPLEQIIVTTSDEVSDDPLAAYLQQIGVTVFRGPLDNVFERFRLCLDQYPCSWFFRVCADSPLLDSALVHAMMSYANDSSIDLITNIQVRSFPKGCSLELINARTFANLDRASLTAHQREHVTRVFYDHSDDFEIVNIHSGDADLADLRWTVDTVEDLARLENETSLGLPAKGFTSNVSV